MPAWWLCWLACAWSPTEGLASSTPPASEADPARLIPPQCWTQTQDADGSLHNPCYVCHQAGTPPTFTDDSDLQAAYDLPLPAAQNPWTNLFRVPEPSWTEAELLAWVRQDNLSPATLPEHARSDWTFDATGRDSRGWVAFPYLPLPGAFWPTNGSFDDVLIRLPEPFRGEYAVNLAVLEALILRQDVPLPAPVDEGALDVDLDGDGTLGQATQVAYRWPEGMSWVGDAKGLPLAAGTFPVGTEFLHSLRYLDVVDGRVQAAPRAKELRYMVKERDLGWFGQQQLALAEVKERDEQPDLLRPLYGSPSEGYSLPGGWRLQAWIEDAEGDLRPQTDEEHRFCTGCHSGLVGGATDSTWAFARKVPGGWGQQDLRGLPDRDYAEYLRLNGAADELRSNDEAWARRDQDFSQDVSILVIPSPERAQALNGAYRVLVEEQSLEAGRQPVLREPTVHRQVEVGQPTGLTPVQPSRP